MDYSFTDAETQPRVPVPEINAVEAPAEAGRKSWPLRAIVIMQTVLFLGHWLIYHVVNSFWTLTAAESRALGVALLLLSVSFTISSTLSFRSSSPLVSAFYKAGAVWLGSLNFLFWAACLCEAADLVFYFALPARLAAVRTWTADGIFAAAAATIVYGFVNARMIRVRRVTVSLPHLPESWRGRKALLMSDLHLGHVNGARFARRIARMANRIEPDIIFIAGDLFDGPKVNPGRSAAPLFAMKAPLGTYFCEGNHEDYGDADAFCAAIERGGIEVLRSRAVTVDGVQILGVSYADSVYPLALRSFLEGLALDPEKPSILLNHVPNRLQLVEQAGVSLQLSGHTHQGQIFPFTWFTRRMFGRFTYGLQRFGKLQVFTSSGAGTWGPPMRVGSAPEVVVIGVVEARDEGIGNRDEGIGSRE